MEVKSSYFNKTTILLIFVLFMFSDKLWNISWDIGKSLLIVIGVLIVLNQINPSLADNIREIINDFFNIGSKNNFIMSIFSGFANVIMKIKNFIFPSLKVDFYTPPIPGSIITKEGVAYGPSTNIQQQQRQQQQQQQDYRQTENRNLVLANPTNNRKLS